MGITFGQVIVLVAVLMSGMFLVVGAFVLFLHTSKKNEQTLYQKLGDSCHAFQAAQSSEMTKAFNFLIEVVQENSKVLAVVQKSLERREASESK